MALPVVLKSGKNYMSLVLDKDLPFPELLQHILNKFLESQRFFGTNGFALMFEGRELSSTEKLQILDLISEYTTINITNLIENDKYREYAAEMTSYEKLHPVKADYDVDDEDDIVETQLVNNCIFIDRDVEAGEKVTADANIVVNGNVNSGSILRAGNNIIILGALYGQAIAGNDPANTNSYIMANEFDPENYRIGPILGKVKRKRKKKFGSSKSKGARIAQMVDGEIQIEKI